MFTIVTWSIYPKNQDKTEIGEQIKYRVTQTAGALKNKLSVSKVFFSGFLVVEYSHYCNLQEFTDCHLSQ